MKLVLTSYGTSIRRRGTCFLIKHREKVTEISAKKVEAIIIANAAFLSTGAIKLATEHNIDIVLLSSSGQPFARIWQPQLGSTTRIRRRQLELIDTSEALSLVISWIGEKIMNQSTFLQKLQYRRKQKLSELSTKIRLLEKYYDNLQQLTGTISELRGTIQGIEGSAGRCYFQALSLVMPKAYQFNGRSRNPARDPFNCMLNYAYGILYSMAEKACIVSGLDPYIGFMHTDNYNKPSLVLDLIEPLRIYAEEPVVYLFTGKRVRKDFFTPIRGGVILNQDGKKILLERLSQHMEETLRFNRRNIKRKNIIQYRCQQLVSTLLNRKEEPIEYADLGDL